MYKKQCLVCGATFEKSKTRSVADWNRRAKYCSMPCRNKGWVGRKSWNKGLVGDPRAGKPWLGKSRPEMIAKMAAVNRTLLGEKSPHWKGDEAGYAAIHMWIRKEFKRTGTCDICKQNRKTQWASKSKTKWLRIRSWWQELCPSCHKHTDLGHKPVFTKGLKWEYGKPLD